MSGNWLRSVKSEGVDDLRETIVVPTHEREELIDITGQIEAAVHRSGVQDGLVSVMSKAPRPRL